MQHPYSGGGQYSFGPGAMSPVVKMLLLINVGVFLPTALIPQLFPYIVEYFGLTPQHVVEQMRLWELVTWMFVHGGITHILFNMLILWMFGVQLERIWGQKFFLHYYFITGIGAGLTVIVVGLLPFAFAEPTYLAPTIGASGAIYGLLVAFALYYPETPILMFFLFPVPAKYFVMIIGTISFLSVPRGGGVSHVAHLGGLVVGYLYLKRFAGRSLGRSGFGRLGIMADIKYRYFKWKMGRLKKRFDVYQGRRNDWDDRIH